MADGETVNCLKSNVIVVRDGPLFFWRGGGNEKY